MASTTPVNVFDAHFHIWDMTLAADDTSKTQSGHDPSILFSPNGNKLYGLSELDEEIDQDVQFNHVGGAWVEAVSVCYPSVTGVDKEFTSACLTEAKWVNDQLLNPDRPFSSLNKTFVMVATAALEAPNVADVLAQLKTYKHMRGIRQIVNHQPDWPRNGKLGNLLKNPEWRKGYALLKDYDFSFDLQLNPHQLKDAAELIKEHPGIPAIVNHMATPTLDDLVDADNSKVYFEGIKALADLPNVTMKISMLSYTDPKWNENEVVLSAVKRVIKMFGSHRCFFASNFPVETKDGWPAQKLFRAFLTLSQDPELNLTEEQQRNMFSVNAQRAYRV